MTRNINKIITITLAIILFGCSNHDTKFESCADTMFILTNELMKKRMTADSKTTKEIEEFNSYSYVKKK